MAEKEIYNMTFTAGAAMLNEMHAVADDCIDCGRDWERAIRDCGPN